MSVPLSDLQRIQEILSRSNQVILEAGYVKLFLASPDPTKLYDSDPRSFLRRYPGLSANTWTDTRLTGIMMLVYDRSTHLLGFQLFNLQRMKTIFAYHIYFGLNYKKLSKYLHCFEMDDCVMGFLFADSVEANGFHGKVQEAVGKFMLKNGSVLGNKGQRDTPSFDALFPMPNNNMARKESVETYTQELSLPNRVVVPQSPAMMYGKLGAQTQPSRSGSFMSLSGRPGGSPSKLGRSKKNLGDSSFSASKKTNNNNRRRFFGNNKSKSKTAKSGISDRMRSASSSLSKQRRHTKQKLPAFLRVVPQRANDTVNLNMDGSINVDTLSVDLKKLLKQAGVKKRDLNDPNFSQAIIKDIQRQEMIWEYQQRPEYKDMPLKDLTEAVDDNLNEYGNYLSQLAQYEQSQVEQQKANKRDQGLAKWAREQGDHVSTRMAPLVQARKPDPFNRNGSKLVAHNQRMMDSSAPNEFASSNSLPLVPPPTPSRRLPSLPQPSGSQSNLMRRAKIGVERTASMFEVKGNPPPPPPPSERVLGLPAPRNGGRSSVMRGESVWKNSAPPPPTPVRNLKTTMKVPEVENFSEEFELPPPPPLDDLYLAASAAPKRPELPPLRPPSAKKPYDKPNSKPTGKPPPAFLTDISAKQFNLNDVAGGLQFTLQRLKNKKMSANDQMTLLKKLKDRLNERREFVQNDDVASEDSDWSVE